MVHTEEEEDRKGVELGERVDLGGRGVMEKKMEAEVAVVAVILIMDIMV